MTMKDHIIGNYRILDKIGEGGMGEVFLGVDRMLEREVAIKSLRPEFARRQDLVERFRTEAMALARLNHPNIATLYSFFRQDDSFFMVMEFVRGKTLDKVIAQSALLSWRQAIPLFCQALQGIAHAHRLGVVHRDIKPANLMLADTGTLKVLDFGIARLLGTASTTKGHFFGTLAYMSPEQIRGQHTDTRTDVYTLGIVLYEMLTGRVPFTAGSEYELIKSHVEEMPISPRQLVSQLPASIEDVVMRALAKAPADRFQTADEMCAILEESVRATSLPYSGVASYQELSVTRCDGPSVAPTPSVESARSTPRKRLRLPQLPAFLPLWLHWKQYPGVVALLLLVSLTLGLIGTTTIRPEVELASSQTNIQPPPSPLAATSTNTQSLSVSVPPPEKRTSLPRLSPEPDPEVMLPGIPFPSFPEPGTISGEKPTEAQESQSRESWQEDTPAPKQKSRIAKRSSSSGKGRWTIIK